MIISSLCSMDEEENASLCERILWDLDNIFKKDSNILEFDIIDVVESTCNKSPVIYTDHHLALEKWCVPHLYHYAYKKLLNYKQNNNRADYNLLHQWTRITLLLNPDFTTAWNLRRDLLMKSVTSFLEDFQFTELVLIRKPKCASVFGYREWLLNNYVMMNKELNENLILNELKITLDAADRYSRNYYAWSHRTWILTVYIWKNNSQIDYVLNKITDDLSITKRWLERHVSDYSCFQHRQCLFHFIYKLDINANNNLTTTYFNPNGYQQQQQPSLQQLLSKCKDLLFQEFHLLDQLWQLYPDQESLYLHRRFLLHAVSIWDPNKMDFLRENENHFHQNIIKKLISRTNDDISEKHSTWQNEMIRRYLLYLKRNLNWTFDS